MLLTDNCLLLTEIMTPTLLGRWQTRLFLIATIGFLISLPFALSWGTVVFVLLVHIALFGIIWDVLYIYLQKLRWDRDWSALLQLLSGIWEALFLITLIKTIGLPGVPSFIGIGAFCFHYTVVWLGIFTASQTLMRVLFPYWRFNGGRLF